MVYQLHLNNEKKFSRCAFILSSKGTLGSKSILLKDSFGVKLLRKIGWWSETLVLPTNFSTFVFQVKDVLNWRKNTTPVKIGNILPMIFCTTFKEHLSLDSPETWSFISHIDTLVFFTPMDDIQPPQGPLTSGIIGVKGELHLLQQ